MVVRVLGTRYVDFVDKDSKTPVKGVSIYVSYPEKGVNGERYNKAFVPVENASIIPEFDFGDLYDFQYECDGFGKSARQVLSKITKV